MASRAFDAVMLRLEKNFVPLHLGPDAFPHATAKENNTAYSRTFFGDHLTLIWDGTYLFTQRTSDYARGRKLFSGQKKRHLVKFMSLVFPNGKVFDVLGPFYSNGANNDSGMTAHIPNLTDAPEGLTNEEFVAYLEKIIQYVVPGEGRNEESVAIVDRGVSAGDRSSPAIGNQGLYAQLRSN